MFDAAALALVVALHRTPQPVTQNVRTITCTMHTDLFNGTRYVVCKTTYVPKVVARWRNWNHTY